MILLTQQSPLFLLLFGLSLVTVEVKADEGCHTCREMLFDVFIAMFSDANAQAQITFVSEESCALSDDQEACASFFSDQWLSIWTAIFQIEDMSLVICGEVGAEDNCDSWQTEELTCQSCQERMEQFALIESGDGVLRELKTYLATDGFCFPRCETDETCEERCEYYIHHIFHDAVGKLAVILGEDPTFPCSAAFGLCEG